jgi:hypothetical protein
MGGLTTSVASEPRGNTSFFSFLPGSVFPTIRYGAPLRRHCVVRWVGGVGGVDGVDVDVDVDELGVDEDDGFAVE